jgi:hypothetical protein
LPIANAPPPFPPPVAITDPIDEFCPLPLLPPSPTITVMFPEVRGNGVYKIPPAPPPDNVPPAPPPATIKAKALDAPVGIGLLILWEIVLKLLSPDVKVEYTLVLKIDPEYA